MWIEACSGVGAQTSSSGEPSAFHHPRTQQYKFLPITSQAKAASSVKIPSGMDIVRQYECLGDSILGALEDTYYKAELAELLDLIREYLVQAAVSMAIIGRNCCKANLADLSNLIRRSCSMLSIGNLRASKLYV